jgi:hypothetical protein
MAGEQREGEAMAGQRRQERQGTVQEGRQAGGGRRVDRHVVGGGGEWHQARRVNP